MATSDREAFRAFLRQLHYAPQGRLARAGELEERDLDALLRPRVAPVWRWVSRNVAGEEQLDRIRRNVRLAARRVENCQRERAAAAQTREQLSSRRAYLTDALRKARDRERALLASLAAVEGEQRAQAEQAGDAKRREVLARAQAEKEQREVHEAIDRVREIRSLITSQEQSGRALQGGESPVDVLLREYLRLLKARGTSSSGGVEFGDRDVAHVRRFGGRSLREWLEQAAKRDVEAGNTLRDEDEALYAAHVEAQALPSQDALAQVKTHLRRHQRAHIARFSDTQTAYARARRAAEGLKALDYEVPVSASVESKAVAAAVELEMQQAVERAALAAAEQAFADATSKVETARRHKLELEEKLELLASFDRRQCEVLAHLGAVRDENEALMAAVATKQAEVGAFAERKIVAKHGELQPLLRRREALAASERAQLTTVELRELDRAVQSVAVADGVRRDLLVPFAEFYTNQLKRDGNSSSGFSRVFAALGLSPYSNWEALVQRLEAASDARDRHVQLQALISQLEREVDAERRGDAPDGDAKVQALLDELRGRLNATEEETLPQLESALAANAETASTLVPRVRTLTEDFYARSGWTAQV